MNNDLVFKILKKTVIFSFFVIGFSMFLFKNPKSIIYGYIFGALISMLGFKLLNNTINKSVLMKPSRASRYSTLHYVLRYIIYFIVLLVSVIADYLNFPATILGLTAVKFVIIFSAILDYNSKK
jgi:hypothetical protein